MLFAYFSCNELYIICTNRLLTNNYCSSISIPECTMQNDSILNRIPVKYMLYMMQFRTPGSSHEFSQWRLVFVRVRN